MKKETTTYLLGGAAALGLGLLFLRKKKQPLFITTGGEIDAYPGQMFTVRLPRGDYTMLGGDGLILNAQVPRGDMTDLAMIVKDTGLPFTVTPTFIDQNNDGNQHSVTVRVQGPEG